MGRERRGTPEHPATPEHVDACAFCQDIGLWHCTHGDHRHCHLDPMLECEVTARWHEPILSAARAALSGHDGPSDAAVVSRPAGLDGEPTVHGVGVFSSEPLRRIFWNAKRRLGLDTELALHGRLLYVLPDDDALPFR